MIRSILVPLDGSTFGEHALPFAMSMARKLDVPLHLMHVHSLLDATYAELQVFDNTLDQELRNTERDYLQKIQKQVQDRLPVHVTIRNIEGDVATAIREQAESMLVKWVVMTTHAKGPFERFWMGSVTDELVRSLPMPLVLIHATDTPPDLAKEPTIQHMLVPLDGTPLAEEMLEPAFTLCQAMKADVTLLRVVTPVYPMPVPAEPAIFGAVAGDMVERVEQIHAELTDEAAAYLDKIALRLRADGMTVHTRVAIEEQPGVAILENAKAPIDMVALETHARGGLSRLLLGSVADQMIRGTHLPILLHHRQS